MEALILTAVIAIVVGVWFLIPKPCHKEQLGYRCRHQMHGNVKECGDARN